VIDFVFPDGNRPNPLTLMALVPGFLGVAIVAWQNLGNGGVSVVPIFWLLAAALSWSIGTVISRRTSSNTSSALISGMQLSLGGGVLFTISFFSGEVQHFSLAEVSAQSLEAVVYLIVSGSVIGFVAYNWLLNNVQTTLVSTYTFINPIVAVLLGTLILGEPFSASMVIGACLVIVSIAVMWGAEHSSSRKQTGSGSIARREGTGREFLRLS
jgi:drug/metabolite transporter (DMT)-like permease